MPAEPAVKRAIAFVDGQNLFHNVRNAFGYTYPNYDVQKLAQAVCTSRGWTLERVQFYTGRAIGRGQRVLARVLGQQTGHDGSARRRGL